MIGALIFVVSFAIPAAAQDIRGLEVCTAEKDMTRRTGCLQTNVEFLQQALTRETRRAQEAATASGREIAALKSDVAALKAALDKARADIDELKKAKK